MRRNSEVRNVKSEIRKSPLRKLGLLSLALWLAWPATHALACAACGGQSDDLQAQGMNWGIFTLLGVIVTVLGGVGSFFIYLARRAASTPEPLPEALPDLFNPH